MKNRLSLVIISVCLPFILWGVCGILPTFDDFTTLQSTWFIQIADPGYFYPDAIRRPFDFLFGCLLGYFPSLFPVLNHIVIILGHTASTFIVYALCRRLNFSLVATNIAVLFFFFSPATLGATLACDGLNQTYAQLWGLLSLWCYLGKHYKWWICCLLIAMFCKDNGLAWSIVPPIIAYAFQQTDRQQAIRHTAVGLFLSGIYFACFLLIKFTGLFGIEYVDEYGLTTMTDHLKDFIQLMAYTWVPVDFMSAVFPPTHNWMLLAVTALMTLPFLLLLARQWQLLKHRQLLSLIACFLIVVSPHLVTLVSIMHNYAALSMAALIIAYIVSHTENSRWLIIAFTLYLLAALFTDIRHYKAARQSGELGRQMAMQVINSTERPFEKVLCISIDDDAEPRYSNFCVRPVDAFAWGLSVRHYSHYEWKTSINTVTLADYNQKEIETLTDSAFHTGHQAVWIVGHDHQNVKIITP